MRALPALDAVAHLLYSPTVHGCTRTRWHHRIHLIPARWMAYICDKYERSLEEK